VTDRPAEPPTAAAPPLRQARPYLVCGAALLVDPYDEDSIARGIVQAVTDDTLRADLIRRGHERARSFSWTQSVKKIHEIYMEVAR